MKTKFLVPFFIVATFFTAHAQELQCNVQVMSRQVQGTNKQVFTTLQEAIYEFMNTTIWTNHVFAVDERIECNFLINITDYSSDQFTGNFQIQARRPVYNSSYNSVLLNYKDDKIKFDYVEFEPLEFNLTSHGSNLTSLLAFYAYIVIGLDYDSFSQEGGTQFFELADKIVENAQVAPEPGWKAFESTNRKNRYWLVKSLLDDDYSPIRTFNYRYHRLGLDVMDKKVDQGRAEIAENVKLLQQVYRDKPDPFMHLLQVTLDAKSDEIVNVFSEGPTEEKTRVFNIMVEIDPAGSSKYEKIIK